MAEGETTAICKMKEPLWDKDICVPSHNTTEIKRSLSEASL